MLRFMIERRKPPAKEPPQITTAETVMWLSFDAEPTKPLRWLCVSPIENEGSGLPPLQARTARAPRRK
jgi:hypothetical protein